MIIVIKSGDSTAANDLQPIDMHHRSYCTQSLTNIPTCTFTYKKGFVYFYTSTFQNFQTGRGGGGFRFGFNSHIFSFVSPLNVLSHIWYMVYGIWYLKFVKVKSLNIILCNALVCCQCKCTFVLFLHDMNETIQVFQSASITYYWKIAFLESWHFWGGWCQNGKIFCWDNSNCICICIYILQSWHFWGS